MLNPTIPGIAPELTKKKKKNKDLWLTPNTARHPIIHLAELVMGHIDLDPCSNEKDNPKVPAKNHYTIKDNGLLKPWSGNVYLNPPYSKPHWWLWRLANYYKLGFVKQGFVLVAAGTLHNKGTGPVIEESASAVCLWGAGKSPRIAFLDPDTKKPVGNCDFNCAIIYWGNNVHSFRKNLSAFGHVLGTLKR